MALLQRLLVSEEPNLSHADRQTGERGGTPKLLMAEEGEGYREGREEEEERGREEGERKREDGGGRDGRSD